MTLNSGHAQQPWVQVEMLLVLCQTLGHRVCRLQQGARSSF